MCGCVGTSITRIKCTQISRQTVEKSIRQNPETMFQTPNQTHAHLKPKPCRLRRQPQTKIKPKIKTKIKIKIKIKIKTEISRIQSQQSAQRTTLQLISP
jgi:hypothetical protein